MGLASDGNRGLKSTGEVGQAKVIFRAYWGIGRLFGGANDDRIVPSRPARKRKQYERAGKGLDRPSSLWRTTNSPPESEKAIVGHSAKSTLNSSAMVSGKTQGRWWL